MSFYVDNVYNSVDNSLFPIKRHFLMWITFLGKDNFRHFFSGVFFFLCNLLFGEFSHGMKEEVAARLVPNFHASAAAWLAARNILFCREVRRTSLQNKKNCFADRGQ